MVSGLKGSTHEKNLEELGMLTLQKGNTKLIWSKYLRSCTTHDKPDISGFGLQVKTEYALGQQQGCLTWQNQDGTRHASQLLFK
jgi:hypothetical protein